MVAIVCRALGESCYRDMRSGEGGCDSEKLLVETPE